MLTYQAKQQLRQDLIEATRVLDKHQARAAERGDDTEEQEIGYIHGLLATMARELGIVVVR